MQNLAGRAVLVTGGASGLGKAMVERFLAEGARVAAADKDKEGLSALLPHDGLTRLEMDVTNPEAVRAAVAHLARSLGTIDVLVNNAGVGPVRMPLHESGLEDWRNVLDVNLSGAFYCLKFVLNHMLKQEARGNVINIVSTAGIVGLAELPSYAAAKGGLVSLTRSAAIEYGPAGIRVNAVAPSAVVTPLFQQMANMPGDPLAVAKRVSAMNPLSGIVTPEDVASAVAFLASDDARSISGVILPVDGGYTAR